MQYQALRQIIIPHFWIRHIMRFEHDWIHEMISIHNSNSIEHSNSDIKNFNQFRCDRIHLRRRLVYRRRSPQSIGRTSNACWHSHKIFPARASLRCLLRPLAK